MKNNKYVKTPGVNLDKGKLQGSATGDTNLKALAKRLANRKYDMKDNPAVKRLQNKFKDI
ncbi:hypothetical protein [Caldalkalibacillus salinus]|uniref:hypothetical protein n=1 Tax=Caldalkalibacillus salinus TaxID=2803787 RepID=UPI001923BBBF|nr:hypothetical protein [Caldalkalibacillus salinus]